MEKIKEELMDHLKKLKFFLNKNNVNRDKEKSEENETKLNN